MHTSDLVGSVRLREALTESRFFDGETAEVVLYRTSRLEALNRVGSTILKLKHYPHVWQFLRPLEIIQAELTRCGTAKFVELDITELVRANESVARQVGRAPSAFNEFVDDLAGKESQDLTRLTTLVNTFRLAPVSSIANLSPTNRMFILLGTYWGEPAREMLYSEEYFGEAYWRATA